ncbi:hypothetical protein AF335_05820 [Streptomyces eurocidicus]|uniref:Uncharacterized protein n=1 Tax=Streptomyces eurocidicus TaxID=66423 RepID=A0A2N8NZH6_STREU|nr:hypothetical protein [Streptomyces eurocidicus]MBB5120886.1 hypothetical protein [Streptomyces eurocidicus]MBF6054417.1 hypothetical protein [Streptomyces eurocidicus]PNE34173.1 hypothetical protein AF335_05820 [Streptomyces eurocidicus]
MTATPPSPELLGARTTEPRVSYSTFFLRGLEDGADPQTAVTTAPRRWAVLAGPGGVLFRCATTDFHPHVRLESWSAEPPAPPGGWDTLDTVEFELFRHGKVQLNEWDGDPSGEPVDLGGPGVYRLRAASLGRAAARERHAAGEMFFHGTEEWLIQLWPR